MALVEKSAIVAEIERRIKSCTKQREDLLDVQCYTLADDAYARIGELRCLKDFIDTLEVKEVDTWHLQEKESIYNAVKGWDLYTFACVMKDGTIQRFNGCRDEDCEGYSSVYINGVNDDYDNVDDIVKWLELKE